MLYGISIFYLFENVSYLKSTPLASSIEQYKRPYNFRVMFISLNFVSE